MTTLGLATDLVDLESGHPDLDVEPFPTGEERYARLTRMVKEHAFAAFAYDNHDGCLLLDVTTAHLLRQVADALSPKHRAHFLGLDLGVMVDTAWKLVR